jgi:hypothetical protein
MRQLGGYVLLVAGVCLCALTYFSKVPEQLEVLRDLSGFCGLVALLVGAMHLSIKDRF